MEEKLSKKQALRELVDSIMECEQGREIDAGMGGYGPVAQALVALGDYPDCMAASKQIWPDEEDWEDGFDDK